MKDPKMSKLSQEAKAHLDMLATLQSAISELAVVNPTTGEVPDGNNDGTIFAQVMPDGITPSLVTAVHTYDNNFGSALRQVIAMKGIDAMAANPGLQEVVGSFDMLGGMSRNVSVTRETKYYPNGKTEGAEPVIHYGTTVVKTTFNDNAPSGASNALKEQMRAYGVANLSGQKPETASE